ncbi:hypothetical protein [Blastococcus mobilis]|uniref:Uncharacterized protein n=1 Tax=Blastococcus mobilis TaxID=1938746 RepID=A0A238VG85_9ACTN|nr:hypothetical protein [Blastococcus mobilis]SNR33178.1 hypothetical protein SAMN06272737_103100 [Blastococcus mobilis]
MGNALHTPGQPGAGAVSPAEARLDDAGLIAVQGPGLIAPRTGVLYGPGSTTLVTGTSDTAPMTVQIAPHHWVTSRQDADGVYRGALEAARKVSIGAAPASGAGTRIDVVYEKQNDAYSTISPDGTTEPVYAVAAGQPGGAKPAIPVGAIEVATVAVSPGATATNGAGVLITNTARQTVPRNTRIPVRNQAEQDALTAFPGLEVYRLDDGRVQLCTSAGPPAVWVTTFDPTNPPRTGRAYSADAYTGASVTGVTNVLRTIAYPDPGFPHRVLVDAYHRALVSPGSSWNLTARVDTTGGTLIRPVGSATSTSYADVRIHGGISGVLSGGHSVLICAERVAGVTGDGYQVQTEANLQSYRVQVVPA